MNRLKIFLVALVLAAPSVAHAGGVDRSIDFPATTIGGAGGQVVLVGGGTVDPKLGVVMPGGGFRVKQDVTQGPLAGLKAGEGIRWEALEQLDSISLQCGAADEAAKAVVTDKDTIVLKAAFYRLADKAKASYFATVVVSRTKDGGTPAIWIEGLGCGDARVSLGE